jgi:putative transposase
VPEVAEILITNLLHYRDQGTYLLHEFVVMPNHLHLLLTPAADMSLEKAMQLIKGSSSHEIHQRRRHKMKIWQPGFHESTVRDADDYQARRQYIRLNPLQAHLADRPGDWIHGSASGRYVIDVAPEHLSSGAEAPSTTEAGIVGAEAPTP